MESLNLNIASTDGNQHDNLSLAYLKREIACLEKQLKRIRMQNKPIYENTIATYEDMIKVRKTKLEEKTSFN